MRVFQLLGFTPRYLEDFYIKYPSAKYLNYGSWQKLILSDHYDGVNILEPIQQHHPDATFAMGTDGRAQNLWAAEHGLTSRKPLDILCAQVEEHRSEVFYNHFPLHLGWDFMKRLPGCVKKRICFHSSLINKEDLSVCDLLVGNYPPYLKKWQSEGLRCAYVTYSHEPVMKQYALNEERPIDISFVGALSFIYKHRRQMLESLAVLADKYLMVYSLWCKRFKPWLDVRILHRIPSPFPYLPKIMRKISMGPLFGRDMYNLLGQSKIVLNISADFTSEYCVNMRSFEAMGCGGCMIGRKGIYPKGMIPGEHFIEYTDARDAIGKIEDLLNNPEKARAIGQNAAAMLEREYSKTMQWENFATLVNAL